jgi:hypothetical protein
MMESSRPIISYGVSSEQTVGGNNGDGFAFSSEEITNPIPEMFWGLGEGDQ